MKRGFSRVRIFCYNPLIKPPLRGLSAKKTEINFGAKKLLEEFCAMLISWLHSFGCGPFHLAQLTARGADFEFLEFELQRYVRRLQHYSRLKELTLDLNIPACRSPPRNSAPSAASPSKSTHSNVKTSRPLHYLGISSVAYFRRSGAFITLPAR